MKTTLGRQAKLQMKNRRVIDVSRDIMTALQELGMGPEESIAVMCSVQGLMLNGALNVLGESPLLADDMNDLVKSHSDRLDSQQFEAEYNDD